MKINDELLEVLEEEIIENIEWLSTTHRDEIQCISIENLESILTRLFQRKITLKLK